MVRSCSLFKRNWLDNLVHQTFYRILHYINILPLPTDLNCLFFILPGEVLLNMVEYLTRPKNRAEELIPKITDQYKDAYGAEERIAIITGGSSGIGKSMAKAISKAGFHVIIRMIVFDL